MTLPTAFTLEVALALAVALSHAQTAAAVAKVNGKETPLSRADDHAAAA